MYAGMEAGYVYGVRSKLVHEGKIKPGLYIEDITNTTGEFVTDLLKATLVNDGPNAPRPPDIKNTASPPAESPAS
jgi:hypothetical protein